MVWTKYTKTFEIKNTNPAQIVAGEHIVVSSLVEAQRDNNLPHNVLTLTNKSTLCAVGIFLDDFSNVNNPDYVVFANQTISINVEDGESWSTLFLKNLDTVNAIAIGELNYNVATVKELER